MFLALYHQVQNFSHWWQSYRCCIWSVAPAATSCVADSELCNVGVPDETRYTFTTKVESMLEPELSKSMVTAVAQFTSTVTVGGKRNRQ